MMIPQKKTGHWINGTVRIALGVIGISCFGGIASAQEAGAETPVAHGLAAIDWAIIVAYGLATIGLGYYFSRKQTTTKEYFVGSGNMPWFLIGVSLFATLLSTISYLSIPGEIVGKGPIYGVTLLAYPIVFIVVGYFMIPVYMEQRVTSAYELLETKLGLSVRLLGVGMFLLLRLVWMSLLVYLTAKAMSVMMGVGEEYIPHIVLVTGFVAVTYTSLGGMRAVVITDLIQTILLLSGALLVIVMVTIDKGGFSWFPTTWQPHWDTQPLFSFDPKTRLTVIGTVVSVAIWYICTSGGDQVSVQRFMATRDAKTARRALATQLCVGAFITFVLYIVGLALMGYFKDATALLPEGFVLKDDADDLFPRFISFHLPIGISGLVVSAMFAAAMSSIDSGVNSITAVVMTDLLDRFGKKPKTERGHVILARSMAFGIGAIIVLGSVYVGQIQGNITEVTNKTANLLVTPIFGLFYFSLFVKNSNAPGVWIGWFFGTTTAVLIAFSGDIFGRVPLSAAEPDVLVDPVSFLWIAPCTVLVNVVVGHIACKLFDRGDNAQNA